MPRRTFMAALATAALLLPAGAAQAASSTLVINEVDYDQPGTDTAEFVEIANVSPAQVALGSYTLRFGNGNGGAVYDTIPLPAQNLAPGGHLVVCANAATVANCDVDDNPNTDFIQNGAPDAVALFDGDTKVDSLSYEGVMDGYTEGPAGAPTDSGGAADQSIARAPDGCDTDTNASDFKLVAATPGTANGGTPCSGPPGDSAPTVSDTDPADGEFGVAPDRSLTVTFSEAVTAAGAFALACSDGHRAITVGSTDQTTFTIDPAEDLPRGGSCTLTVDGDSVADVDAQDPPDTMAADREVDFHVAGLEGLRIHDIQGAEHRSPYEGSTVDGVPGIVTAVRSNGFWMQDVRPDDDRRTSEGIFVFGGGRPPVGSPVTVDGLVEEFRPGGDETNLTTTEISNPTVTPGGEAGTIEPTLLGAGGLHPPLRFIDSDSEGDVEQNPLFDPWQDGIDFHESLEGMWVEISRPVAVGPTNSFDELPVVSDGAANLRTKRGGVLISPDDFNPERFILDDGMAEPPDSNTGDGFSTPVQAIVDYSFGNYKYLVTASPQRVDNGLQPEVTDEPGADELATGSMNVENLSPDDSETKFLRLARILVGNMRSPDLVALEEIQDNDGTTGGETSPVTDASETWRRFIEAVQEVGGPTYSFAQIDPVDDQDGGVPGGNIRVGFLYREDRGLEFVSRPGGTSTNATHFIAGSDGPELTFSPGRVEPQDEAWVDSRKPLAGEFRWRGEKLFAIANHFNSKGGDQPLFGRFQPPQRISEVQRHKQATLLRDFVREALDIDPGTRIVVMGDLNDFEFSGTLDILEGAPLWNLMDTLPRLERYSYVFDGNSQTLDQILVTRALHGGAEYDSVHVNAEFADQASDHDPQVARLDP